MPQPKLHKSQAQRQAAYRKRQAAARIKEQQARGLPALPQIPSMPGTVRWEKSIAMCQELLSCVRDEMQGYYDDRSEAWQESDRACDFQERLDALDEAIEKVDALL